MDKQINNISKKITDYKTNITDQDRIMFNELDFFIGNYNENQKKAIISPSKKILCVAGAGSGKTSVLTKRIEFLIKYRGVDPKKILAITFTRKAKQEMKKRLIELGVNTHVQTFNSFSEKVLRIYGDKIYRRFIKVIDYREKIIMIISALDHLGLKIEDAIDIYFKSYQKINSTITEHFIKPFKNNITQYSYEINHYWFFIAKSKKIIIKYERVK